MIIDCHMHLNQNMLSLPKMLAGMNANGIDKTVLIADMVESFSLGTWPERAGVDLLRLGLYYFNPLGRSACDMLTIDKKGHFVLLGKKYRIIAKPDNAAVAAAIEEHPDRFMGWMFINPSADPDYMSELERWSSNPAMIGVKAHPFWHDYPVRLLEPAAAWCRERGYPMLIHLGSRRGSGDYRRLPEKYPGLKIVYAHAGIPYFRKLWAYIRDMKDVHVDLSSVYLDRKLVRKAVDFLGPGKCLYGTDGPYSRKPVGEDYDYGWIKGWVESLPLSDREREMIFGGNFQALRKR